MMTQNIRRLSALACVAVLAGAGRLNAQETVERKLLTQVAVDLTLRNGIQASRIWQDSTHGSRPAWNRPHKLNPPTRVRRALIGALIGAGAGITIGAIAGVGHGQGNDASAYGAIGGMFIGVPIGAVIGATVIGR
jgi:hypothetical protein